MGKKPSEIGKPTKNVKKVKRNLQYVQACVKTIKLSQKLRNPAFQEVGRKRYFSNI
jgi:hypothetical protein